MGIPDSIFGVAWPAMHVDFGLPVGYAGIVIAIISVLAGISSIAQVPLARHLSTGTITYISCVLTAVGLIGYSFCQNLATLVIYSIPLGLGAGGVDTTMSNYVSKYHSARYMNYLYGFAGIGSTIGPLMYSLSLKSGYTWRFTSGVIGAIQLLLAVILVIYRSKWRSGDADTPDNVQVQQKIGVFDLSSYLRIVLFFILTGAEVALGLWASSALIEIKGVTDEVAAIALSMYFASVTLSRFVSGYLTTKLGNKMIIRGGLILALAGTLLIIIFDFWVLTILGFMALGFGHSPIYPCLMHDTHRIYEESYANRIVSYQIGASLFGSIVVPSIMGLFMERLGLSYFFIYIAVFIALVAFIYFYLNVGLPINKKSI